MGTFTGFGFYMLIAFWNNFTPSNLTDLPVNNSNCLSIINQTMETNLNAEAMYTKLKRSCFLITFNLFSSLLATCYDIMSAIKIQVLYLINP